MREGGKGRRTKGEGEKLLTAYYLPLAKLKTMFEKRMQVTTCTYVSHPSF